MEDRFETIHGTGGKKSRGGVSPDLKTMLPIPCSFLTRYKETPARVRSSERLIFAQIRKTTSEVSSIKSAQVVSFRGALQHLRIFLPLLIAFSLVLTLDPQFLSRSLAMILHPFSNLPVRETFLSLDPKGATVLRGAPVVIRAQAAGHLPDKLTLTLWPEGSDSRRLPMESEGEGQFSYRIASVQGSFGYPASHGSALSPVYSLQAVDPPEIGKIRLTLIPPEYTGLPAAVKEEGQIEALKGTVVNLEAPATKAVKEGKVILDQENELLLKVKEDPVDREPPRSIPGDLFDQGEG